MSKKITFIIFLLIPVFLFCEESDFSRVDRNITRTFFMFGLGGGIVKYPSYIENGLEEVRDTSDLSRYNISLKLGLYMPWISKRTLVGFRSDLSYDRIYSNRYYGSGAVFESSGYSLGIDLQQYFGSRAGRGPFIHLSNSVVTMKFASKIGVGGYTPWGYGLNAGCGFAFPIKIIPGLENTSVTFDYDVKFIGSEHYDSYNFQICFGGFF